ncbi:MAG: Sec-independent protein translocase protein TatB [Burkholderiales bacterium]|nr:Sec-independent protein translocase protein TatB [Burkholderiales bacterium]
MFDIGFSELLVIGVVALIVIGPERLPRVARTVGHLMGRLQRYVADVRADISREMEMEELRRMRASIEQTASTIESTVRAELARAETELNRAAEAAAGAPAAAPGVQAVADASEAGASVAPASPQAAATPPRDGRS